MRPPSPLDDSFSEHRTTIAWSVRLWVLCFLLGQVVAAGLAPGLRGAFIGAGPAIKQAHLLGSHVSQFAALLGLLLLVYLGVLATRACKGVLLGIFTALMGTVPAVVLYHASRGVLPSVVGAVAAVVAAGVVLSSSTQSRSTPLLKSVAALSAIGLVANVAGYFLLEGKAPQEAVSAAAGLTAVSSWLALGLVAWAYARRQSPFWGALPLGLSLFPAGAAQALSTTSPLSREIATLGHTISALTGEDGHFLGSYGFSLALALVLFSVLSPRSNLSLTAGSLLVLCAFSPVTPAGCAAATLAGYILIVHPLLREDSTAISSV